MKKDELGGACRKYGEERSHAGFSWGNVRERDHLDRDSRKWKDNTKIDPKVCWKLMEYIYLV
jgi:hypothetical protein